MKTKTIYSVLAVFFCSVFTLMGEVKVYETDSLFSDLGSDGKGAIVMVHFGTTHDDTRALTLDALNALVKEAYPGLEVREAYTSRIVMKRLGARGIVKLSPRETLLALKEEGFTHLLIQPTQVIDGVEMESLRRDVAPFLKDFKKIRIGTQLLDRPEDYKALAESMTAGGDSAAARLWVGHGTYDVSTAQYCMLDYVLRDMGFGHHVITTIEGYPGLEEGLRRLRETGRKRVILSPLLIVSGEHAKNDIAIDVKRRLEAEGYEVALDLRGLGEYSGVRKLFLDKIKFTAGHRKIDIMRKKKIYAVTGEKLTDGEE